MVRLSAAVITRNEERNLPNLLGSLAGWVDEVVVVDSESEDRTVEVARSFGCRVVPHPRTVHVDEARAVALREARGEWILSVDADEMVTPALARRMLQWMDDPEVDVYRVPRLNHAMGEVVRGARWGPDENRPLALFRRGAIEATRHVHAFYHPVAGARVARPPYVPGEHIVHFGTTTFGQMLGKVDRYTTLAAMDRPRDRPLPAPRQALVQAAREFLYLYVKEKGHRDGWRGLAICAASAFHGIAEYAKAHELRAGLDEAAVRARYQAVADALLAEHREAGLSPAGLRGSPPASRAPSPPR